MIKVILAISMLVLLQEAAAQNGYWQQAVKYKMSINMDVMTNQFSGTQNIKYTNNSPDTLKRLYYHLYFNAFQPGSMMDTRSLRQGNITNGRGADWDGRVRDRIKKLQPEEIGYQKITSFKVNGVAQKYTVEETILVVDLSKPILPKQTASLDMVFNAQVPLQIRRSGRDNPNTKVRFSMAQWYPKLCEYDMDGWHPNPYVGREFYGVWGDYEVNITIDKSYILGGTGYLQNGNEIGYGYEAKGVKVPINNKATNTWKFIAPNVHDFMWAADPDYKHITRDIGKGRIIHVLYDNTQKDADWEKVADAAVKVLPYMERKFGEYPYKQYSFIHGGDGGMEYPMGTLLVGPSLGTVFHEWMHSWYQMMLGTNEALYAWMDEGFTEYATNLVDYYYRYGVDYNTENGNGIPFTEVQDDNYASYFALAKSGVEEPLTTHADHFNTNYAYSSAAYNKGCVFINQLGYVIGEAERDKLLLNYYNQWRFKHPRNVDLIRMAEKQTGIELDWYNEYFVNSTKTIDYRIDSVYERDGNTMVQLRRVGLMPMPIDLLVITNNGEVALQYIPLNLMYNTKNNDYKGIKRIIHNPWAWTSSTYTVTIPGSKANIKELIIDASNRMADVNRKDNTWNNK